jgi:hypothetical protein
MKRAILALVVALVVGFGLIQLVPGETSNPPVESDIPTPPEVKIVLRRACYDCHSHETVLPWYSRIAPVSWLVTHDVTEGRAELNFSTWNEYTTQQQVKKLRKSWEEVEEGEMPPWFYTVPHQDAKLSVQDRIALRTWVLGPGEYRASQADDD